jgi:phospholipid transport system substrate-binding protein
MNGSDIRFARRTFLAVAAGAFASLLGGRGAQALTPAEQYVAGIGADVIRLANSGAPKAAMRKRFASLVDRYANVRGVALLALGQYQQQLPPNRRQEFFDLVANYIAAFFVYYLDDFKGTGLDVKSSVEDGASTIVDSKVAFGGRNADVRWRITSGRVSDVKVRGIWLSLQLKKRFTDILKRTRGDFGPLFAELKSAEGW